MSCLHSVFNVSDHTPVVVARQTLALTFSMDIYIVEKLRRRLPAAIDQIGGDVGGGCFRSGE